MTAADTMPMALQDRFAALLEEHQRILFKVANTYARQPEDRADLAQEIAAQLWRAFPAYDSERSFPTWMYRIALNVAISHVRAASRRSGRMVPLDAEIHDTIDPNDGLGQEEQIRALYRFIDQLDPLHRALLLLYLDEHSYREIAEILGITETNVATKINRLKQRIRTEMKGTNHGDR